MRGFAGHGPARRARVRGVGAVAAVMVAALLAVGCSSGSDGSSAGSGNSSSGASGKVAPDLAFFKGKTITYIVPNTPGSPPGLIMTAMKPGLEKYLGATINIEYNTNVATVGEDIVGSAKPDGLTLGNMGLQVVLNEEYTGKGVPSFSLDSVSMVGATYAAPAAVFGCEETAFSSYSQLLQSKAAVKVVEITTGSNDEFNHLLMAAYPVPHQYLSGYTTADVLVGCQRGDGNLSTSSLARALDAAGTAVVPGLTPLLLTGPVPAGSPNAFLNGQVPTLAQYAKENPPANALGKQAVAFAIQAFESSAPNYTTFGPPGIPAARLLALTDAFTAVSKTAAVEKAALQAAIPPGFASPATVKSFIASQLAAKSLVEQVSKS
jgi:tripartite-type tricarboxylate transporter receptor subunit TctC